MASKRMRLRLLSGMGFAVILALIFIVPASAASLVSYDFENEGANNWTSTTETWSVVQDGSSSVYYQSSSSEGRTSAGNSGWTNYSVQSAPTPSDALSAYNLTGFSAGNSGGGIVNESNTTLYKKVYTATDLAAALKKGSGVKVIEIMNDLNLGWNEIPSAAQTSPFAAHNSPLTHPVLLQTGVSKVTLDGFDGLTIFSANGAKIKHASFAIKRSSNLIIRNLEFDELWEWDEASKGISTKTTGIISRLKRTPTYGLTTVPLTSPMTDWSIRRRALPG